MKIFKNKTVALISLIIGILLVVYAVLSQVIKNVEFFELGELVGNIIIGFSLVAFASLIVFPKIGKSKSKTANTLRIFEFIVLIAGAIIGFILPAFDVSVPSLGNGSFWIGLALVLNGGIDLYLGTHGKVKNSGILFFVSFASAVLGGYIYGSNLVDKNLRLVSFLVLLGSGIFLVLMGLFNVNRRQKKAR